MVRTYSRVPALLVLALALALAGAGCSLERASPTQPTPALDLGEGAFAERVPMACTPDPELEGPTFFNPDVQEVLDKLGCGRQFCHTVDHPTRLKLQQGGFAEISVNFLSVLMLLDSCDKNAIFLTQPFGNGEDIKPSLTHMGEFGPLYGKEDYQVLLNFVLSCAPFSTGTPDPRCGNNFSLDGGISVSDASGPSDVPQPQADMTADAPPGTITPSN